MAEIISNTGVWTTPKERTIAGRIFALSKVDAILRQCQKTYLGKYENEKSSMFGLGSHCFGGNGGRATGHPGSTNRHHNSEDWHCQPHRQFYLFGVGE